ncbi:MAG TPA: PAS domain-containing sensor histidine kinase [Candidatus Saccharimonadales bacterium]|nr:PAS domain-containing sensor histidine kinase [Candidatus Saccharimonadales bacterium]
MEQKGTSLQARHRATLDQLERYKSLVESIQDYAIFLLDKDGYVQTWNIGAQKLKGYKPEEIIGKHFSTFYLERDKQARKPERELELAQKFGRVEDEDWRVRKDAGQFWANVVITALYENGELVGFAKITRDLTERKMHEDTLRRANTVLRQQQRELEQLNNSKDEFISLASHQLRTPATSIKQYLGMIIEGFAGEASPTQLEFIKKAYDSNEHQLSIVNSLLQVAQIDAGSIDLTRIPTDLGKMLTNVVDEHLDSMARREQNLVVNIAEDLPKILVDPHYLRMAFENLVDNASKYTPERGDVAISAQAKGGIVVITVKDTGVGIADENLARLFKKFSRIPNVLSDSVGGSGLGLYWVNRVVELHGGKIEVTSRVSKGTTFVVRLPVGRVDA